MTKVYQFIYTILNSKLHIFSFDVSLTKLIIICIWTFVILKVIYDIYCDKKETEISEKQKLKKAKHAHNLYDTNMYLDAWFNRIYDDTIYSVIHRQYYNYFISNNYVMKVWTENPYYGYYSKGQIWSRVEYNSMLKSFDAEIESKAIIAWHEYMPTKKTRYKFVKFTLDCDKFMKSYMCIANGDKCTCKRTKEK